MNEKQINEKLMAIVESLKNAKCRDIASFDLTDAGEEKFFVVVSAPNADETKRIADLMCEKFECVGEKDGYFKGEWIILNFEPVVLHIFTLANRTKYNLDRLYKSKEIDVLKYIKKKKSK